MKQQEQVQVAQAVVNDGMLWHALLGHVLASKMNVLAKACDGNPKFNHENVRVFYEVMVCGGCAQGKRTTSPFALKSISEVKTQRPLDVVHTDVMGPMKPSSKGGAQFVVTFIDDFSRFLYVYLLASKAHVFDRFCEFQVLAENQPGCKIKCV